MSMDFHASRFDPEKRMYEWVFPHEWMHHGDYDDDDNFTPNHAYREDLNLNLSNGNMRDVFGTLGFAFDDGFIVVPIDEFIGRATAWLKQQIGKLSAEEPDRVERGGDKPSAQIDLTFLKRRKYDEFRKEAEADPRIDIVRRTWDRLVEQNRTLPDQTWETFRDKWLDGQARIKLQYWENEERAKHEQPMGGTIIYVGKPAGYYNEKIQKMVLIAREGKQMGATHVTAG
jgi:hypothetical protein